MAEVVRCLHLSFSFRDRLCRAFLDGYRTVTALSNESLARAVHNLHCRSVRDLWVPRMIYRHGDDRPRRFLSARGFTTIADSWPAGLLQTG